MLPEVGDALDCALKNDVAVFASAGNSGNNKNIAYPASADRVFKIFAATAKGQAANFSPPIPVTPSTVLGYSYHTYGCDILSAWPSYLVKQGRTAACDVVYGSRNALGGDGGCCRYMSGTSFATPIAASVAATIYQFYNANDFRAKFRRCQSPSAMRAILERMSRTSPQAPYNFLDPVSGRDNYFDYEMYIRNEKRRRGNMGGARLETRAEFFKRKLEDALHMEGI